MNKNLIMTVLGLTIGVLVLSTVLVPIVGEAQKNAGETVTFTNPLNSVNKYHYDYVDEITLTASDLVSGRTYSTYVVNGENIAIINDYMLAVLTDTVSIQIGTEGQFSMVVSTDPYSATADPAGQTTLTFTAKNGNWKLEGSNAGTIYEGTYSWAVTYVPDGEFIARNGNPTNFYNSGNPSDFILYSGQYTSGELDTFYAYGNGAITCGVSEYSGTVNFNNNVKVDGTTDVYRIGSVNVTISDGVDTETFTPYRSLVKETIIGHEDKGAAYSIYAVIPVLMIVALMVYAISVIRNRD